MSNAQSHAAVGTRPPAEPRPNRKHAAGPTDLQSGPGGEGDAMALSRDVTGKVVESLSGAPDGRMREVMTALVRHLHDFAREVHLTPDELYAADRFLTETGQICSESRHEFQLLSDTLGLTMVVDTISADLPAGATQNSVLGPFYRRDAPRYGYGEDLSRGPVDGESVLVTGRVTDGSGTPVAGAQIDVWNTNGEGMYENLDADQPDMNLRGRLTSRPDGTFAFRTVKPVSYPVPSDGPAGRLLYSLERHNMRPAHMHFIVSAPGFKTVVTEMYTRDDAYIDTDAVFGVKDSLLVDYYPAGDAQRRRYPDLVWTLDLAFVLDPGEGKEIGFSTGSHTAGDTTGRTTRTETAGGENGA